MARLRIFRPDQASYRANIVALRDLLRQGELTAHGATPGTRVEDVVRGILEQVARGGDAAAAKLASELDRAELTPDRLRVPEAKLEQAHREADPDLMALVRRAADN